MKINLFALLALATAAFAQNPVPPPPPVPHPPSAPGIPGQPMHLTPGMPVQAERPVVPNANYRLRVEIKEGKEAPVEFNVVTMEGKIRSQMINPKRVTIDGSEVPSTLELTANLTPLEDGKCRITLFLVRTIPYVTGKTSSPDGRSQSQYQQMHLGLDTTVLLSVGKPMVVQADSTQQIKLALEKVVE